jgi:hypothetical protein
MADAYLQELSKRIARLPGTADVSVVLAYADYGGEATTEFVRRFFPFSLIGCVQPFYPNAAAKNERRSALVRYVDDLERRLGELRDRARVVRDVLSGRNFTPLLLPLRNFESEVLAPQIDGLFQDLAIVADPRASLNDAAAAILSDHPLREEALGKKRKRWFEDDRKLRFRSPGSDRHGMARLQGQGHLPECLIAARVRLGGPFDSRFHFDCEYEKRGLDAAYPNCHDASTAPAAKSHVNIAPSDYVR